MLESIFSTFRNPNCESAEASSVTAVGFDSMVTEAVPEALTKTFRFSMLLTTHAGMCPSLWEGKGMVSRNGGG